MALDRFKTDPVLGNEIQKVLETYGVETPQINVTATEDEKINSIMLSFRGIMNTLGLDLTDDSLMETPKRFAKMYVKELLWGLDPNNFPKITTIDNKINYDSLIMERHIKVCSICEHHFISIIGEAFIAYVPNEKVVGLSKLNRIVEYFCRRPQVQERLCEQIFYALCHILDTENVAVMIRASHNCVKLRGVEDINSDTITTRLGGNFFNGELRNEFYSLIKQ